MEKQTLVWAHRGASGYAPENTLEAFRKAIEMGADGVELDVQLTKDGELVVIHDETVDRTSDGSGWVKDFTYARISRFNYNRTHKEGYERAMIPTLEEVYELLKPTGLTINVELKTGVVFYPEIEERVLDLTARMGKKHGKRVHVWTVNEEQYMRMVCEMQVDAMITNYPDVGRRIAAEYLAFSAGGILGLCAGTPGTRVFRARGG